MIQVNEDECIVKILDIDSNQVDEKFIERISGKQIYTDEGGCVWEHIYSAEMDDKCSEEELELIEDTLDQIKLLCHKYRCPYWRIINIG